MEAHTHAHTQTAPACENMRHIHVQSSCLKGIACYMSYADRCAYNTRYTKQDMLSATLQWLGYNIFVLKTHPISCPHGQAVGCLLWIFWSKLNISHSIVLQLGIPLTNRTVKLYLFLTCLAGMVMALKHYLGQVTKLWLSCYLVLLSIYSKTR